MNMPCWVIRSVSKATSGSASDKVARHKVTKSWVILGRPRNSHSPSGRKCRGNLGVQIH